MGLVGLRRGVELPAGVPARARSPRVTQVVDHPVHGLGVLVVGAEISGFGERLTVAV